MADKDLERQKELQKAWKAANPEKIAAAQKRWRERNPDKVRMYEANRKPRDPEKVKAADKARSGKWAKANPERAAAYFRQWALDNPDKVKKAQAAYRERHPGIAVRNTLRHKAKPGNRERINKYRQTKRYGITPADYDRMLAEQNGLCLICKQAETHRTQKSGPVNRLSVDHCHKTNKVRGLLCHHCNAATGLMNDDPERLRAAAAHIERHR